MLLPKRIRFRLPGAVWRGARKQGNARKTLFPVCPVTCTMKVRTFARLKAEQLAAKIVAFSNMLRMRLIFLRRFVGALLHRARSSFYSRHCAAPAKTRPALILGLTSHSSGFTAQAYATRLVVPEDRVALGLGGAAA